MALIDDRTTITIHSKPAQFQSPRRCLTPTLSSRRRVDLDMDTFRRFSLGHDKPNVMYLKQLQLRQRDQLNKSHSDRNDAATTIALPTPPLEDDRTKAVVTMGTSPGISGGSPSISSDSAVVNLPAETVSKVLARELSFDDNVSDLELAGVVRKIGQSIDQDKLPSSIKIISQVMPSCGVDARSVKTYETLCEQLQLAASETRYISIHHSFALSEGQTVQDLPRSPPVTPNLAGRDSYFGEQSIFTHFAQVPVHHGVRSVTSPKSPSHRNIMPPEASLVILERYIPPTIDAETSDLFDPDSCRSYLADRLLELSNSDGTMVLIYPTKTGGQTFARQYLGPVLEPILRELVILRGLATTVAETLGRMSAIDELPDFEAMQERVRGLCTRMNERGDVRNSRSAFTLVSSQSCTVRLSRETWLNWYIDQEVPRLKQNLTEFREAGGRLPQSASGVAEVSEGLLVREITSSLWKSDRALPAEAIEIGVFVVKRART